MLRSVWALSQCRRLLLPPGRNSRTDVTQLVLNKAPRRAVIDPRQRIPPVLNSSAT